jgi:uncharacterized protein YkwD
MKLVFSIFIILFFSSFVRIDSSAKIEAELYRLIMDYRASKRLPKIPLSKSLTTVAKTHAIDLDLYYKIDTKDACNMHSWSDRGTWTSCCYTNDHKRADCMWNKPSELSNYIGAGYEIAHWSNHPVTAMGALAGWKQSKGHNEVIVNKGIWKTSNWKAIGIGIKNNYAVVWFGEELDVE